MGAGRSSGEREWLIKAPLDPREVLHDDAGLVLQSSPLRSSLDAGGPFASDDLAVFQSQDHVIVQKHLLFQLAHGKPLGQACCCLLVGPGVLRVSGVGRVGGSMVGLLWSVVCVAWIIIVD